MAEIKSTLDLIMEKTRDLLPTEAEKKAHREKEWSRKIRGHLRRVLDGAMSPQALLAEISSTPPPPGVTTSLLLKKELMDRIDPGADNERILGLLESLCGENTEGLKKALTAYRERVEEKKAALSAAVLADLAARKITGPAVSPNVESHEDFRSFVDEERNAFRKGLEG